MQYFDRDAVQKIVSDLELALSNRRLARHWLSLWSGNVLPDRSALKPADLKPLLSNLIMFDVIPNRSVVVRLAGTMFNIMLGAELTGRDWIEMAPAEYRAERLRIFSDIAAGAIGRGVRTLAMSTGDTRSSEEIILPFRGENDSDLRTVLAHIDLDVGRTEAKILSREQALGPPLAFETILLPLLKAA